MASASLHLIHWNSARWMPSTPFCLLLRKDWRSAYAITYLYCESISLVASALLIALANFEHTNSGFQYSRTFFEIGLAFLPTRVCSPLLDRWMNAYSLYFRSSNCTSPSSSSCCDRLCVHLLWSRLRRTCLGLRAALLASTSLFDTYFVYCLLSTAALDSLWACWD